MLICLRFCDIREVENLARMQHRLSQCGLFGVVHSFEKDRHQECGNLIVSNFASGHAIDEERDLFTREFRAVTFFPNDVLRPHRLWSFAIILLPRTESTTRTLA